jgi:hypothetical protein
LVFRVTKTKLVLKIEIFQTKQLKIAGLQELQPVKQVVRLADQAIENCRSARTPTTK